MIFNLWRLIYRKKINLAFVLFWFDVMETNFFVDTHCFISSSLLHTFNDSKYVDVKRFFKYSESCLIQSKALRYKLFFLKALSKRLWKLTINTKRLSQLKSLSFLNFKD